MCFTIETATWNYLPVFHNYNQVTHLSPTKLYRLAWHNPTQFGLVSLEFGLNSWMFCMYLYIKFQQTRIYCSAEKSAKLHEGRTPQSNYNLLPSLHFHTQAAVIWGDHSTRLQQTELRTLASKRNLQVFILAIRSSSISNCIRSVKNKKNSCSLAGIKYTGKRSKNFAKHNRKCTCISKLQKNPPPNTWLRTPRRLLPNYCYGIYLKKGERESWNAGLNSFQSEPKKWAQITRVPVFIKKSSNINLLKMYFP